jgi:uncharacterized protein involved in exopolysaccharide biosynthesis
MSDRVDDRDPPEGHDSGGRDRNVVVGGRPVYVSDDSDAPSVLEVITELLRHRKLVVALPIVVAGLAVGHGLISDITYSVNASFMPQGRQAQVSQLGGIAAQFGINLPDVGGGESPQFYADLLHSTRLLGEAVDTRYKVDAADVADAGQLEGDLIELYQIEGETRRLRREAAIERLRRDVTVSTHEQTGVVRFSVAAPYPDLARQLTHRLIELVQSFNVNQRQSRAKAERDFLESRVEEAQKSLFAVEDSLERFLDNNRSYQSSPALRFDHDRLQRRVSLHQQVYTSLAQSLEQAKVQAVRNTPVVTVVEPPRTPPKPDSRGLIVRGILGLFLGGMIAVFVVFGFRLARKARRGDSSEYEDFLRHRDDTLMDVRRLAGPAAGAVDTVLGWFGIALTSRQDRHRSNEGLSGD